MELTPVRAAEVRSLERRWSLADAPPIPVTPQDGRLFVPSDLRIRHRLDSGGGETWSVIAMPADKADGAVASWMSSYADPELMPEWIAGRAAAVRADLAANRYGTDPEAADRWTHSIEAEWALEGFGPLRAEQSGAEPFIPAAMTLTCWVDLDGPEEGDPFRVQVTSAESRTPLLWRGNAAQLRAGRVGDLPPWIRVALADQYRLAAAKALASADART